MESPCKMKQMIAVDNHILSFFFIEYHRHLSIHWYSFPIGNKSSSLPSRRLQFLLCLLIFVLDLKSLQSSHWINSPFFSLSLFPYCMLFCSSFNVYILSFNIAHVLLWWAIFATFLAVCLFCGFSRGSLSQ